MLPKIEVGFSITTLDDKLARTFEPIAPPPSKRIEALQKLKENDIKTRAAINPILPYFTDQKDVLSKMVDEFKKINVDCLAFDKMNYVEGRVEERLRPVYARFGQKT